MIKDKEIVFTDYFNLNLYPPTPAIKNIPQWYKKTEEYVDPKLGKKQSQGKGTPHTIKKCMPVFDAISAGYILYTPADIEVQNVENVISYFWPSHDLIGFHPVEQAPIHPLTTEHPFPKINNPWGIKTPPGYSCLITNPMHNPNNIFTILPGIVDTDKYVSRINFPFVLNNKDWEGLIPAGTPMAQVIPFKRDSWKHRLGSHQEIAEDVFVFNKVKTFFYNSYKLQFWSKKNYR